MTRRPNRFQIKKVQLLLNLYFAEKEGFGDRAERMNALGEMAAIVAHEIRNPVAIIKNAAAGLRKAPAYAEQSELLCGIIDEETSTIERIIDDMLAFASPLEVGGKQITVAELVERAIYLMGERGGELSVAHGDAPPPLVADPHRVSHALVSVIANGRHATSKGGDVTLRTSHVEHDGHPYARIDVVDTGTGIAPENLDQVFQPFFTTKNDGTGLGLALVKRTIDAHGGRIWIDSERGRGTTVTIELPCQAAE